MVEIGLKLNFLCIIIFLTFLLLAMDLCEMGTQVQQMAIEGHWFDEMQHVQQVGMRDL